METFLFLAIFNFIILLISFKTKLFLYTITPEKQWEKENEEFEKNLEAINKIEIANYKLGSGHLYETH
jgi:hypothetical protein